ncbi:hypothetical protein G8770_16955 [Aestuariicella hydrocarbonica]|uniref:Uncharacterized protein n=1 Tax=Pseudomaricurvus hydrocarbonicus TaxID=1470433 RepID=A0A9E5MN14_9GAMM|nr:hypothetical protein [Aestuariicella hydrocarbonica]NHO67240.1 hypothetical protein [Aestuariicella hydrocarbonica]
MTADKKPSNWQQSIDGEWHGRPSLFEADGTHVGYNKVTRASEHIDGRTNYWMDTKFDATGPLNDRFELGSNFDFGVIDSDQDRIYTGPDFIGSGRPFGLLVDSNYFSPGWNVNLRTMNHVVPDLGMQVYSSQLFEGDTLIGVFNGLYVVTHDMATNPDTQTKVDKFLEQETLDGKRPYNLPVKHAGVLRGEFEVYNAEQELIGHNQVTIHHKPINLLHSEQTIEIEGVINRRWTTMRTRNGNHHQYHGPHMFGNGMSYGRYLYSIRHVYGEAFKLWSRETQIDENHTYVCAWQFQESHKEKYMTFGVLRWEQGDLILGANYID